MNKENKFERQTLINMVALDHCDAVADYLKHYKHWDDDKIHSEYGIWKHPSGGYVPEYAARDGIKYCEWNYLVETYDEYIERQYEYMASM